MIGYHLRRGVMPLLAGLGIGIVAALALTRTLTAFLFGVSGTDAATFAATSLLLLISGTAAAYLPARAAARVDPMVALREE